MHTHIHIVCVCVCVNVIVFVGGVSKSRRVSWDKIVARVVYEKKRVRMCVWICEKYDIASLRRHGTCGRERASEGVRERERERERERANARATERQ